MKVYRKIYENIQNNMKDGSMLNNIQTHGNLKSMCNYIRKCERKSETIIQYTQIQKVQKTYRIYTTYIYAHIQTNIILYCIISYTYICAYVYITRSYNN